MRYTMLQAVQKLPVMRFVWYFFFGRVPETRPSWLVLLYSGLLCVYTCMCLFFNACICLCVFVFSAWNDRRGHLGQAARGRRPRGAREGSRGAIFGDATAVAAEGAYKRKAKRKKHNLNTSNKEEPQTEQHVSHPTRVSPPFFLCTYVCFYVVLVSGVLSSLPFLFFCFASKNILLLLYHVIVLSCYHVSRPQKTRNEAKHLYRTDEYGTDDVNDLCRVEHDDLSTWR